MLNCGVLSARQHGLTEKDKCSRVWSLPVTVCRVDEADGRVAGSSKGVGGQRGGVREEGSKDHKEFGSLPSPACATLAPAAIHSPPPPAVHQL